MKQLLSIAAVILILAPAAWSSEKGLYAESSPPATPTVYFSNAPNFCYAIWGTEYWIFVHSPDDDNFESITFDLEVSGNYAIQPVLISEPGVTVTAVLGASTWQFHLVWSSRTLDHTPILKLLFLAEPEWLGFQTPTNVVFGRSGGEDVPATGLETFGGCCVDCFPCGITFYLDDPALGVIGQTTEVGFDWSWFCYTYAGGVLTVSDTEGWVSSWVPDEWISNHTCGHCFVERHPGVIVVDIPTSVTPGTTSSMTISTFFGNRTVTLEAIEPVPVQTATWGAVKALFD